MCVCGVHVCVVCVCGVCVCVCVCVCACVCVCVCVHVHVCTCMCHFGNQGEGIYTWLLAMQLLMWAAASCSLGGSCVLHTGQVTAV